MAGMQIYLVGGAVRDRLLGRPVKDRDYVVVGATPEAMEAGGYRRVGADFPVFLHPQTHCEYALARTERKTAPGYRGFAVHASPEVTLEEDLKRRDLTINAMAEDAQGRLIDPYGGARDLSAGLLRHVSPAFVEDPLRVLRVARFAARFGFAVAPETLALMKVMADNGELATLAPERVWSETERALGEPAPRRYLEVLRECGALASVFPEIDALFGIPQPEAHHPEIDTGLHTLMTLEQAARLSPDPQTRFAALVHDIGKAQTPRAAWPRHHGHEEAGAALVAGLGARLRAPREWVAMAEAVARYHLHAHRARELKADTLLRVFEALDLFRRPQRLEVFLGACEADARGRTGYTDRAYPQADYLRVAFAAARQVDGQAVARSGLQGLAIAAKIRALRVDALEQARAATGATDTGGFHEKSV